MNVSSRPVSWQTLRLLTSVWWLGQLRREGMRLFLLWYEILMDNATEECHKMFRSLVPKLRMSDSLELDLFQVKTFPNSELWETFSLINLFSDLMNLENVWFRCLLNSPVVVYKLKLDFTAMYTIASTAKLTAPDNYALLLPQSTDKQPENLSKYLLDALLFYMVSEVRICY